MHEKLIKYPKNTHVRADSSVLTWVLTRIRYDGWKDKILLVQLHMSAKNNHSRTTQLCQVGWVNAPDSWQRTVTLVGA